MPAVVGAKVPPGKVISGKYNSWNVQKLFIVASNDFN